MARTRNKPPPIARRSARACAQNKSYVDISADEDEVDAQFDSAVDSPPPPRAPRSSRHTRRTSERTQPIAIASDSEDTQDERPIKTRQTRRSAKDHTQSDFRRSLRSSNTTQKRRRPSYVETSDAQDSDSEDYQNPPKKRRITPPKAQLITSSPEVVIYTANDTQRIPDWTSLPFSILCQIFHYASLPSPDDLQGTYSTKWLLAMAVYNRSFMEPCLQALYRCPPLAPMRRAHELVQNLEADQNGKVLNYRNKIECIRFEVSATAGYKHDSQVLDVHGLVRNSTRLKDLEIYCKHDFAPYEDLKAILTHKWKYPDSLFAALEETWTEEVEEFDREANAVVTTLREHGPIKLRSWRWSSRLAGPNQQPRNLEAIHLTPSFNGLRKIAFVNYNVPEVTENRQDDDDQHDEKVRRAISMEVQPLADSIQVLSNLQHLIFESCTLLDTELISSLPGSLQVLEVINCPNITSDDLTAFLVSKGGHLRELHLNHNRSLSLSFLPVLATACPHLEVLRMDLHYFGKYYEDSNPAYESILLLDEVPMWPSSLRIIDLNQLRNWDLETAEMFFQSLVDSSANLPHLRQLIIKTSISMDWKIRAGIRQKWEETMEKVFLSRRPPPNSSWTSIKAMQSQQDVGPDLGSEREGDEAVDADDADDEDDIRLPQRSRRSRDSTEPLPRSHRSTRSQPGAPSRASRKSCDDSVPMLERGGRTTRSALNYADPETSDDSGDEPATPSTPKYANGWNNSDLASPPSTAGRKTRAGSDNEEPNRRATLFRNRMSKELAGLQISAGNYGRSRASASQAVLPSSPPTSGADSDDEVLQTARSKRKAVYVEPFVQGMCDKVEVSIGNLRPRQKEYVEGDFLDQENENDSSDLDWDGDDTIPGEDVVYHF